MFLGVPEMQNSVEKTIIVGICDPALPNQPFLGADMGGIIRQAKIHDW